MTLIDRRAWLIFVSPKLQVVKFSFDTLKFFYRSRKNKNGKMQLPVKLAIGSISAFFFIILVGFVFFPRMLHSKVRGMVNLGPETDIRGMFLKVPFALSFKVYIFNVTNPMEVQEGKIPIVKEVGPFCYEEWKDKLHVEDGEGDDTISYNPRDTFIKKVWPGCRTGKEVVTIPHPMILGMVNTVIRQKPGALSLISKAIKSIYGNPSSIFLTATADEILFDGISINCAVSDFAGKAICTQLKSEPSLRQLDEDHLLFALMSAKNATEGKRIKALRGTRNSHDVGRIIEYDGAMKLSTWPDDECNTIEGTDGTIFPPFLKKEEGIISFAADLCRSLKAFFVEKSEYNGVPVGVYSATLGDMSTNEDEKCYCYTPETCLKKGMIDLYKCSGVPVYASFPHFYDTDESYLKGVKGLSPNKTKHEIKILFEAFTGSPVYAAKRLQFNMPLEPNQKVELFKNFKETVIPLFWIEEGIALNKTITKPLKLLFTMKRVVGAAKWLILLGSVGGLIAAGYMFYNNNGKVEITPIHKVKPADGKSAISTVNGFGGHVNHAMSQNDVDKY